MSLNKRVYLSPPHMGTAELELLTEAFKSNWIAPLGPHVDAFEREFADNIGCRFAVAVSSGTAALHLALRILGIGDGDRVITSSMTFCATANSIRYQNAEPIFIDSDRETWNACPQLLEDELLHAAKINQLPKAAMIVDVNGQCADYRSIKPLLQKYEIPLIEDAAEALGATHQSVSAGRFGAIGCFSFNGNKIITTSGGGMLVTDNEDWAKQARHLATQARDPAPHYEHSTVGYNYRLSNLLAAIGRGQLSVLDDRVASRRAVFDRYVDALGDIAGIEFMPEPEGFFSTRWLTSILVDESAFGTTREAIRLALEAENIESRPVWKPMHMQPVFAKHRAVVNGVSERLFRDGLCLPSGSSLSEEDQQRTIRIIRSLCK
jgi:dTDP-4-amino-4,6-dideoxygalactose transaminase